MDLFLLLDTFMSLVPVRLGEVMVRCCGVFVWRCFAVWADFEVGDGFDFLRAVWGMVSLSE